MSALKPTSIIDLGRNFQLDLFSEIIIDPKFGETIIERLEPTHFSVDVYQKLIVILKKYYEKHETILNFPNLRTEIDLQVPRDQVALKAQILDTVDEIEKKKVTNKNVQEFSSKFCKLQSLKNVLGEINKKVERGIVDDYDQIEKGLTTPEEIIEEIVFSDLNSIETACKKNHAQILGWLIASKQLEIKIGYIEKKCRNK